VSTREHILSALRRAAPRHAPRPHPMTEWQTFEEPVAHFARMLAEVGGTCVRVVHEDALRDSVSALEVVAKAERVASLVPEAHAGNVNLAGVEDPHDLASVDVAVLRGAFAVAENGAVWVPCAALGARRALLFVCQHLVLVVDPAVVVHTLHDAYARLRFEGPSFGTFVSGPSKTADIEQALVIGAHGARSATVFLVG
jgi:L-lactate dehydrogenase complex protein LldG